MTDYVLVRASKPEVGDVQRALANLVQVREVHPLFGEWDFIVKVSADPDLEGLGIVQEVRRIRGVLATKWLGVTGLGREGGR